MRTDLLTNPTVKAAIDALQCGDRASWSALFEHDATLERPWEWQFLAKKRT